jgi:hypothetical protein
MGVNTAYCRLLLPYARQQAKQADVKSPKYIVASRADSRHFWVEAKGVLRRYVRAVSRTHARAKLIVSEWSAPPDTR